METQASQLETPATSGDQDRWLAIAVSVMDETRSTAERRFGAMVDGKMLDRYALEAAIELLSAPARVTTFLPDLAMRQVRDAVAVNSTGR